MLVWLQVVLLLSLLAYCLVFGNPVVSQYSIITDMPVSTDDVMRTFESNSRIECVLRCHQHSNCFIATFNRTIQGCSLHQHRDTIHNGDSNQDVLLRKGAVTNKGPCKESWWWFLGSCYFFSQDKKKWQEAEGYCQIQGGNLVKINDAVENFWISWITLTTEGIYWIGANDLNIEGLFVWSADNTNIVYSNWYTDELNDMNGNEDCVDVYKTRWNDADCDTAKLYICKI